MIPNLPFLHFNTLAKGCHNPSILKNSTSLSTYQLDTSFDTTCEAYFSTRPQHSLSNDTIFNFATTLQTPTTRDFA